MITPPICSTCNGESDECRDCCDHSDTENGHCLDCGDDRTEQMMSDAYDRFKDRMKYGD